MYAISDLYTEYLQQRSREWLVKANIAGTDYGSNIIVDFEIENSLTLNEEFEIGTAILSKLTLKLKTSDVIAANAKVVPYVALQLPPALDGANVAWQDNNDAWQDADYPWQGGVTEWLPLGEFYIDSREQVNNIWVFTCYDKLVFADVPYVSALTYPTTMQALWDEICTSLGYIYDSSVVIDPSYMIQVGPAGYSKRQVLAYIASANSASVYISKDGVVRFRRFDATDAEVFAMTNSEYIKAKQTNPEKTYTRIVVTYNTDDQLTYEAGTGDDNHTLYIENPFATQAIVDDLLTKLNGFSYIPSEIDARGYPQIEAGDRMRFGVYVDTPTWDAADVAWEDADYSWDGYTSGGQTIALHTVYSFRGGLKMSVEAQSKSEQKSEFIVEGTLTQQVNNLNKNAVKEGKSYFGATITREDGFIVEKSDHSSKVTLNSDELKWEVGGELKLYYDALADKLKFGGTLEAADGVFSGSLSAATGTFAGELQAATGTFTGDLSAAGGTFSGTLSGVDGDFSGEITATSGTIGGWTIESDKLSGAGEIEGGTITGPLIQSAVSGIYPRIEMASANNLLSAYLDESNKIDLSADFTGNPTLVFTSGTDTLALLSNFLGAFNLLLQKGDLNLTSQLGEIQISAPNGIVKIDSFSTFQNLATGTTLQSELNNKANVFSGYSGSALVMAADGTTVLEFFMQNGIVVSVTSF